MPEPPTADDLVPGETTRGQLAEKIGDMERDRRLARGKLKAVAVHQAPCR